jgi:hypothetical protein
MIEPTKGTQVAWNARYDHSLPEASGPHHFNINQLVRHIDGRFGYIQERTALTAIVKWQHGKVEVIQQLDRNIHVVGPGFK